MLADKIASTGDLQAAYVRKLIHKDLGLLKEDTSNG